MTMIQACFIVIYKPLKYCWSISQIIQHYFILVMSRRRTNRGLPLIICPDHYQVLCTPEIQFVKNSRSLKPLGSGWVYFTVTSLSPR